MYVAAMNCHGFPSYIPTEPQTGIREPLVLCAKKSPQGQDLGAPPLAASHRTQLLSRFGAQHHGASLFKYSLTSFIPYEGSFSRNLWEKRKNISLKTPFQH